MDGYVVPALQDPHPLGIYCGQLYLPHYPLKVGGNTTVWYWAIGTSKSAKRLNNRNLQIIIVFSHLLYLFRLLQTPSHKVASLELLPLRSQVGRSCAAIASSIAPLETSLTEVVSLFYPFLFQPGTVS